MRKAAPLTSPPPMGYPFAYMNTRTRYSALNGQWWWPGGGVRLFG